MEKFNKNTYVNNQVFYQNQPVDVVNPNFRGKVIIADSEKKLHAVNNEDLSMGSFEEALINKYVAISLSPIEIISGIAIDIQYIYAPAITIEEKTNTTIQSARIIYIDERGQLSATDSSATILLSEKLKQKFCKKLNALNLWWNGHSLQKIYTSVIPVESWGIIKEKNNPTSLIEKRLSAAIWRDNNPFPAGKSVYIHNKYNTYEGSTYYSISSQFRIGIIKSNNIQISDCASVPSVTPFKDNTANIGIVTDVPLPHLEYIDQEQNLVSIDIKTYLEGHAVTEDFYRSMYTNNYMYDGKNLRKIISSVFNFQTDVQVIKDNTISQEVLLATNLPKAEINTVGKTIAIFQDYNINLYYTIRTQHDQYVIAYKDDVKDIHKS